MIQLTEEERLRFAAYLEQEAASDAMMIEVMQAGSPTMQFLAGHKQHIIDAYIEVAAHLKSISTMQVN